MRRPLLLLIVVLFAAPAAVADDPPVSDVVVYAATPAGVMAAVAAARCGRTVVLLEPSAHVGGVVSGGLTVSDVGRAETIGGLAREFFDRVRQHYADAYGEESQQVIDCRNGYRIEPHVAEQVFEQMLSEQSRIRLLRQRRVAAVRYDGKSMVEVDVDDLTTGRCRPIRGRIFVDASYTGDLMAAAGVPYRVGRESQAEYGESLAGMRAGPEGLRGRGDHRTQAYNYRICLTNDPDNRIPIPQPPDYDPARFEGMARRIAAGGAKRLEDHLKLENWKLPNRKIDANIADWPGANYNYPEGDWETRARIEERQRNYSLGVLYALQHHPALPESFRRSALEWGLPRDEFTDNGHFPHHIYVREARRMLGRYVITQNDVTEDRHKDDGVCMGSFMIDSHTVQRVRFDGRWHAQGGMGVSTDPYEIPYRSLTPHAPGNLLVPVCISATHVAYATIRMEPVYMMLGHACGLAAHLALEQESTVQEIDVEALRSLLREQGGLLDAPFRPRAAIEWQPQHPQPGDSVTFSVRPVEVRQPLVKFWWDLDGRGGADSQDPSPRCTFKLEKRHTVSMLCEDAEGNRTRIISALVPVGAAESADVTMDDDEATYAGNWSRSNAVAPCLGRLYRHDDNRFKGRMAARFRPHLPAAGRYAVCLAYSPHENRASNAPIEVFHRDGVAHITLNQREGGEFFPFVELGQWMFAAGDAGSVRISNAGTDGYVIVDGARWVWLGNE